MPTITDVHPEQLRANYQALKARAAALRVEALRNHAEFLQLVRATRQDLESFADRGAEHRVLLEKLRASEFAGAVALESLLDSQASFPGNEESARQAIAEVREFLAWVRHAIAQVAAPAPPLDPAALASAAGAATGAALDIETARKQVQASPPR